MISVIILTKNEEGNIVRCLDSVKWCNETIVIDDFSSDKTAEIARNRGARVCQRHLVDDFSAQRNFGLEKAKHNWVLFVDADETIPRALSIEIVRRVKEDEFDAFWLPRKEVFFGKLLSFSDKVSSDWSFGPFELIRLVKKGSGTWKGKVHEEWVIKKGRVGKLVNPIIHQSFPSISTALKKLNYYSTIRAKELFGEKTNCGWWQIILYPGAKFLKNFIWQGGFKDGTRGIIYSILMSFHSFLVRSKLWLLNIKENR